MNQKKKIVILGGGSAGWICANSLAHSLPSEQFSIEVIESPTIGIIGVGEGSTPHLKKFFEQLNIPESEWMPACDASYKTGISFIDWTSELTENRYFHPFPSPVDHQTARAFLINCMMRHRGHAVETNPDYFFLSKTLASSGLSPKQREGQSIPLNYAYHFDSAKLGEFLKTKAKTLGVRLKQATITAVSQKQNGDIEKLHCDNMDEIYADYFFDASGFKALLIGEHLNVPFESFADNLFNDSAIALASPKLDKIYAETKATALDCGWAWHIPLTSRCGNGYVFSSQYCTFEQAETELVSKLKIADADIRQIKMNVGQREKAWQNNVISLGLSQGFIEPLEATAIHLVIDTCEQFVKQFKNGVYSSQNKLAFNHYIKERYDGIRDYIVAHYKVNNRQGTYWQDNRENTHISEKLQALLAIWDKGQDITPFLTESGMAAHYPVISWYCLLAGYGRFSTKAGGSSHNPQFQAMQQFLEKYKNNFLEHKRALEF